MSLDIQRDIGIKRAGDLGFEYKIWNEGGKSSNHEEIDKRPVLSQVVNGIRTGEIKHLFVYDQSRLSRNDLVSSIIRNECNKQGVVLYNKDGKYDLGNAQDQFLKQILDAVAQLDNSQRTERTRLGKLARVKQGNWMGGPPPFGYMLEDRKLIINPDEAKWVVRIFEEYAKRTSALDIKVMLESNGVQTRRGSTAWTLGSLRKLMGNTHFIGYYDYKDSRSGEEVRVECPRIVSSQLWENVQKTKEFHASRRTAENPVKHFYMLRGLLKCHHCGTLLGGTASGRDKDKRWYYCPRKERLWVKRKLTADEKWQRGRECSMTRSLDMSLTDALVWDTVVDVMSKSSLIKEKVKREILGENLANTKTADRDIEASKRKIRQLKKEVAKYHEALARVETDRILEQLSPEQYPIIRQNINKQLIETESRIEQLEDEVKGITQQKRWFDWIGKFRKQIDGYKDFKPEQKKEFLQGLLESIGVELIEPNTHRITLNFQVPIVGDQLVRIGDSKEYEVKSGVNQLTVESPTRIYSKKNLGQ